MRTLSRRLFRGNELLLPAKVPNQENRGGEHPDHRNIDPDAVAKPLAHRKRELRQVWPCAFFTVTIPMNLPVSGKVCSKVRVPVEYFLGSTWVMVTGSRTCGLPSSASVRNGSPFIVVWFPSSLMRRISVSMSRSSGSCISSATRGECMFPCLDHSG